MLQVEVVGMEEGLLLLDVMSPPVADQLVTGKFARYPLYCMCMGMLLCKYRMYVCTMCVWMYMHVYYVCMDVHA